jgi:hypothetical protein
MEDANKLIIMSLSLISSLFFTLIKNRKSFLILVLLFNTNALLSKTSREHIYTHGCRYLVKEKREEEE